MKNNNNKYYSHTIDNCFVNMKIDKYYIQPRLVKHNRKYKSIIGNDMNCNNSQEL